MKSFKEILNEAKPTGKAQIALMKYVDGAKSGQKIKISDIPFKMVKVNFKDLMSAADALYKKGLIDAETTTHKDDTKTVQFIIKK